MRTTSGRRISLTLSGLVLVLGMGLAQSVMAESGTPLPPVKPVVQASHEVAPLAAGDVPLPSRKPTAKTVSAAASKSIPSIPSKGSLSTADEKRYRQIFALQERGEMTQAKAAIDQLENGVLLGHVLAQRYLHPKSYRAEYSELKNWLAQYSDHPQAEKIYKLASARAPSGEGVKEPKAKTYITAPHGAGAFLAKKTYMTTRKRTADQQKAVDNLTKAIRRHTQNDEPSQALNLLKSDPATRYLDTVEFDSLQATVASGYIYVAKFDDAERLAAAAFRRSGKTAPISGWIYGLANWQQGRFDRAIHGFEVAATSPYASGWLVSAASYWAARSHMREGNHKQVSRWLKTSAAYSRTFYGLIAQRALGQDFTFDWEAPELTSSRTKFIESKDAGKRAAALVRVGEIALAESELSQLNVAKDKNAGEALMAYALTYNLPALALKLGTVMSGKEKIYDAALYPMIPWEPTGGYRIDRALIHALIRQESRFNATAENEGSGATGLMQLMPATARYVAGTDDESESLSLKNPAVNLEIGQAYVESLLKQTSVDRDLLSLAIAYNAGPGKLAKWKSVRGEVTDPLLFIETIPFAETRAFVERVLSNYWIYSMRLQQPTPSLDAVVQGQWARYAAMDDDTVRFASAE
jgi:soluble lytic murein transglycosylase-like protein